ncbi:hypothetical protein LTR22_025895 [Elasticomyces elasticus]|nr:hypothetical protein LTR22_025895 [Elasticomyces elasticus]
MTISDLAWEKKFIQEVPMVQKRRKRAPVGPIGQRAPQRLPTPPIAISYTGPDNLSPLPREILDIILQNLLVPTAPAHEPYEPLGYMKQYDPYEDKADFQAINLTCKKLSLAVRPWLFKHMGVTIRLDDRLPLEKADWVKPGLLQASLSVTEHIKNLRLRIEPFPFKNWTVDKFAALVARWAAVSDAVASEISSLTFLAPIEPGHQRRDWVAMAWSSLWQTRLAQWYPLLQRVRPLVAALFGLLTHVQHVEAGQWYGRAIPDDPTWVLSRGLEPTMLMLSYAGAATALVSTMPPQVKSYTFYCQPNNVSVGVGVHAHGSVGYLPIGIDNQPIFDSAATGADAGWMQFTPSIMRTQLETLELTIGNLQGARSDGFILGPLPSAAAYWRGILLPMQTLTKLTITSGDRDLCPMDRSKHLHALYPEGVVLFSIKSLCLKNWMVPMSFLTERLWLVFPNLERLALQNVAMMDYRYEAWQTILSQLPESGTRTRTVELGIENPEYAWSNSGHHPNGTPFEVYGTRPAMDVPMPMRRTVDHPVQLHKVQKAKTAPYAGPDMLSPLPTELHDRILEFLIPDGDGRYVSKHDIQAMHLTCQIMSAAAKPWLFRHMGVTIRLDGGLPVQNAQWEAPRVLRVLDAAPWMGELVKSLQLRIEPFPTKEWTDEEFDDFVSRWNSLPNLRALHQIPEGFRRIRPHPEIRQRWIQRAYLIHLKVWQSHWYRMVQGVQQHITAVFKVLPALRHVEAGQWRRSSSPEEQSLFPDHEPYELLLLSYAGGATALLSALPTQVDSYTFRSHPPPTPILWQHLHRRRGHLPLGIDNQPSFESVQAADPAQDNELMHFTRSMALRVSQMHNFDLNIGDLQYDWIGFQDWGIKLSRGGTAVYWRGILHSMHKLRNLALTSCDGQVHRPGLARDSPSVTVMSSQLCGDRVGRHLDALLDGLVMPSVTSLRLNSWAITASTMLSVLPVAFPNLRILVLEAVIIVGDSADAWNDALSVLPEPTSSAQSILIDIRAPKYSVMEAGKEWWQITVLDSANASAFRHIRKGYPNFKIVTDV